MLFRVLQKVLILKFYQLIELDGKFILMIPKSGTRTLRDAAVMEMGNHNIKNMTTYQKDKIACKKFLFFTFRGLKKFSISNEVILFKRDWDERLKSCWRQKVSGSCFWNFYFFMYFPFLNHKTSQDKFIKFAKCIPEKMREKHIASFEELHQISNIKIFDLDALNAHLEGIIGSELRSNVSNI